jgi:hypothetical protein
MKILYFFILSLFSLSSFAQSLAECDGHIDQTIIDTGKEKVTALICQQGDDVLLMTDKPVKKEHLVYAGLNVGMPYFGMAATYAQNRDGRPFLHVTSTLDGSLGANGIRLEAGKHPFHNALFAGASIRGYDSANKQYGLVAGPTIGLAGTRSRVTGYLSLSYMVGYDQRVGGMTHSPELSMGVRLRLFKSR